MDYKKVPESSNIFCCESCDFNTSRKSQYNRHLLTLKHQNATNATNILQNTTEKVPYKCDCGKNYKHRSSLYKHKTNCSYQVEPNSELNALKSSEKNHINSSSFTQLIMKLINENQDFKNMIISENKDLRSQISEILPMIGNNNNNQTININVFLNEYCKNAISIDQFMDTIDIDIDHLKITMNKGLVDGITNIIMEKMNKLSLYERPIHCTDIKRETMYIKSNNGLNNPPKWEKDTDNIKIKKFLRDVSRVQISGIKQWMDNNPGWETNPALQEDYLLMLRKCTDDLKENNRENKIIRKISNQVYKGVP